MNILDDARSFPSLWKVTQRFLQKHPDILHPGSELDWILSDESLGITGHVDDEPLWKEKGYNGCQFFSNFESLLNYFNNTSLLLY